LAARGTGATLDRHRQLEVIVNKYLAVYTGSPEARSAWDELPDAERQRREVRGMAAWHDWATKHASAIVEMGGPLGRTKLVSRAGIADIRNAMAAYTVVQAESQDAAARLFLDHPHFTIFPGEGVEVMEVMPVPGG
jgi:hypothetical protein